MSKSINKNKKVLEVKNLKKYFKIGSGKNKLKVKAVDDVTFDVYQKEVFGIVGESGCGKTTTGRTLIKLYQPTNGLIKLDGRIVAAGVNDFYKEIKYKKIDYRMQLLKLHQYKYDVYLLKKEYEDKFNNVNLDIEKLKNKYNQTIINLNKDIYSYKEQLSNIKNSYDLKLSTLKYDYELKIKEIKNKAKNEMKIEYDSIVKGVINSSKRKIEGIKESAALLPEVKKKEIENINKSMQIRINELTEQYKDKIENNNKNIISKQDCKRLLKEAKKTLITKKNALFEEYQKSINSLNKPDYKKIKDLINIDKEKYFLELQKYKELLKKLHAEFLAKKNKINSSRLVDKEKLQKLKLEFKNFMINQKKQINEYRQMNRSKESNQYIRQMQMIFQDPISSLNPRMTVQEIISEGLIINGEKDKEIIKKKVQEVLQLVGLLPDYMTRYPHEFSGGQRQRIGIARALIMNPKLIIADEPISALDVSIKAQVINLLTELREKLGLTIIFIAHDLSVVKFFCDRVAVMYKGKIVELAETSELFKHPLHPYTKSLLSAIPYPDPDYEKVRKRVVYSSKVHNYKTDKPSFVEITENHFVYANKQEIESMKRELISDEKQ